MGKVYESEIDPDEFIRSFREESSSLSTLKKKPSDKTAPIVPETDNPTEPPKKPSPAERKKSNIDHDRERVYMERFVRNMAFMAPEVKFMQTEIDPEFIWKIRQILFAVRKDGYARSRLTSTTCWLLILKSTPILSTPNCNQ